MASENELTRNWLNVIGDSTYAENNDCPTYQPSVGASGKNLVPIFLSIGYLENKGVNFVSLVFAPDYRNLNPALETSYSMGLFSKEMDFVNIAFTQQNAFMGFKGVRSDFGWPINMLGIVEFTCAKPVVDDNNNVIRQDGYTVSGGGAILTPQ